MKQLKRISRTIEQYGGVWPPENAAGALIWLQEKIDTIPEELRSSARLEFDSSEGRDNTYATIEISYVRPETGEEEAWRERRAAEQERCANDSARIDWLDDQFRAVVIGKNMDNEGAVGWLTNLGHWSEGWKKERAVNLRAAIDAAMQA